MERGGGSAGRWGRLSSGPPFESRRLVQAQGVHPFGHRKEFNAVFNRIHKFRVSIGESQLTKLPADVKDEIRLAAFLLPLADSNIRWPVSTEVFCSDAAPSADAVVGRSYSGARVSGCLL